MRQQYSLNYCRTRSVHEPEKAWQAAGWDIYIPNDLTLADFTNNYKVYLDKNVVYDRTFNYRIPILFKIENTTGTRLDVQLVLKPDGENGYVYSIRDYSDKEIEMIMNPENNFKVREIEMLPQSKILLPTGLHLNLPDGIFIKIDNKSGIALKRSLIVGSNIIDNDYHGEILVNLNNIGPLPVTIFPGEKFVQMIPLFQPVMKKSVEYPSVDRLYENSESQRGEGGFGSSDKK